MSLLREKKGVKARVPVWEKRREKHLEIFLRLRETLAEKMRNLARRR